jgi:hypothetical protein
MFPTFRNFLSQILFAHGATVPAPLVEQSRPPLRAVGINDFLNLSVPAREMLLTPILPERSLGML